MIDRSAVAFVAAVCLAEVSEEGKSCCPFVVVVVVVIHSLANGLLALLLFASSPLSRVGRYRCPRLSLW
mgnify:CR=1 FL=1